MFIYERWYVICIILSVVCSKGFAIHCYKCDSYLSVNYENTCLDGNKNTLHKLQTEECSLGEECYKFRYTIRDTNFFKCRFNITVRGCGPKSNGSCDSFFEKVKVTKDESRYNLTERECNFCDKDFCNSALSPVYYQVLFVSVILFAVIRNIKF